MLANRGRNTAPELELRRRLRASGFLGYRVHWRTPVGIRPDVVFASRKIAIFLHGCFWHGCKICRLRTPQTHSEFWRAKFRANRARDARKRRQLEAEGWRVLEVWTHELDASDELTRRLRKALTT